jgi:hypothetical protein
VSRARRITQWCAADPGPLRSVAVPEQRCTAPRCTASGTHALRRKYASARPRRRNLEAALRLRGKLHLGGSAFGLQTPVRLGPGRRLCILCEPMHDGGLVAPVEQAWHHAPVHAGMHEGAHRRFFIPHCLRPECEVHITQDCGREVSAREFRLHKNPERLSEKARKIPPMSARARPGTRRTGVCKPKADPPR